MTSTTTKPTTTPEGKVRAGETIHFTRATTAWGEVYGRGATVTIDADMISRTLDREGRSWLDSEWEKPDPRIARGQWPADQPTWTYGAADWSAARRTAMLIAHAEPDPAERDRKVREVAALYGPPPALDWTSKIAYPEGRSTDHPSGDGRR